MGSDRHRAPELVGSVVNPGRSPLAGVVPKSYRPLLAFLLLGQRDLEILHPTGGRTLHTAKRDRLQALCLRRLDPNAPAFASGDATFVRRALEYLDAGSTPLVKATFWQTRNPS